MDVGLIDRIRRMETMSMAEGEGCLCPFCGGTGLTETNSGDRACRCCGGKGFTDARGGFRE